MKRWIRFFYEIDKKDLPLVGGKNASLGEMFQHLSEEGIMVPDGFATTGMAYWAFLDHNQLRGKLEQVLASLDTGEFTNLSEVGAAARQLMLAGEMPDEFLSALKGAYQVLRTQYGEDISVATRSSATAEDLPEASFAGQQETYLNIHGESALVRACQHCFASLFTDRAIKYRHDHGFDHMKVALSVGVQLMVRADLASSGVIFTLEPDTGFRNIILVTGAWGLGENVVQGTVNPDEFLVFKPSLEKGAKQAIVQRKLGSKEKTMVYADTRSDLLLRPQDSVVNMDTPPARQEQYILTDEEVHTLARWAQKIESHYGMPMDIEWAKDGHSGELFIIQARPETVFSRKQDLHLIKTFHLKEQGEVLCRGMGLGNRITSGKARILHSAAESYKLKKGEVLVTDKTDPDWDPILKRAAAIVTDQGGRTSHAAIVAREVGAVAVVGTGNAMASIRDGQEVTVSCAEGEQGVVYAGRLKWEEGEIDTLALGKPRTKVMFILGDPEQAFRLSFYPADGIGLMRLEFVINNAIQIHPMALRHFDRLRDAGIKARIERMTHPYPDKTDYFIHQLSEAVATIAAAFYPREVIVRMSDFKSNEYANLIGGKEFEPVEANPMLGWRGASRYYHPDYQEGFLMECEAIRRVRDDMRLNHVKVMIPFCRTLDEGRQVLDLMAQNGLERGKDGLEIYVMAEIPSNIILAAGFAKIFDGFSIGSNDLTQLTLGVDRDSPLLNAQFDARDEAVKALIQQLLQTAQKMGSPVGLCGQVPSDYPEFAQFLVENGIHSISFNPDALVDGIKNILEAEQKLALRSNMAGPDRRA